MLQAAGGRRGGIESLLLRIPLPVFYLSQDKDGRFKVVDGVQRLTVIRDFMNDRFRLHNLEYLTECNGKRFNSDSSAKESDALERLYVRRIEQTQLTFNIIDPQTPEQVKYDVFRRINTGGANLNRQEIRNCFENPETRVFIRELAGYEEFLRATRESIKPTRMADDEIVLRFIAFYLWDRQLFGQRPYKGDMDAYLDETVELLKREIPRGCMSPEGLPAELQKAQKRFKRAMANAYVLFGEHAFRKSIFRAPLKTPARRRSGSFAAYLRCENLEIHKVFLRFSPSICVKISRCASRPGFLEAPC